MARSISVLSFVRAFVADQRGLSGNLSARGHAVQSPASNAIVGLNWAGASPRWPRRRRVAAPFMASGNGERRWASPTRHRNELDESASRLTPGHPRIFPSMSVDLRAAEWRRTNREGQILYPINSVIEIKGGLKLLPASTPPPVRGSTSKSRKSRSTGLALPRAPRPCGHYCGRTAIEQSADAPIPIDRPSTLVDRGPSLQVRRARARALRTPHQRDIGNNHDDQTTEQGPSRDLRIAGAGLIRLRLS